MKIFSTLCMICVAGFAFTFVSCDGDDEGGTDYTKITLSSDKTYIAADGQETVTFTVKADNETDITSQATITATGATVSGGKFASETKGAYVFKATYKGLTSEDYVVLVGGEVVCVSSKSTFLADGQDFIILTVEYEGVDVTANATICSESLGICLNPENGVYRFTTPTPDDITFYGEYRGLKSKNIEVTATSSNGDFYKNTTLFRFTSWDCGWCYHLWERLDGAKQLYPDRLVEATIHGDMYSNNPDPLTTSDFIALYNALVLNRFSWPYSNYEMRESLSYAGSVQDVTAALNGIMGPVELYPATTGIRVESAVTGDKINLTVTVKSSLTDEYHLGVMLLEDGIVQKQASGPNNYVNNNTYRAKATDVTGDNLREIKKDETASKEYSFDILDHYVVENLKLMVYTIDGTKVINNSTYASIDGVTNYRYEK